MSITALPAYSSVLTIDLDAIRANYLTIAARVAPAECGAVVKANAYGLGVEQVAPVLRDAGCRTFFVAHLSEAFALAGAIGPGHGIYVLNGVDPGCEEMCAAAGFLPVLNSASQVAAWRVAARRLGRALPAALQLDSGMSRLGLDPESAAALASDPGFADEADLRLVMSHLACADAPDDPANAAQLARFDMVRAAFPGVPASIANSGGSFLSAGFHGQIARPGIALYGAPPHALATPIRPVVRLEARVLQIREIAAGTGVGYGLDYVAPDTRRIATIAIGYADGWPRSLSGTGAAWFGGRRLPIVGRVSMDSLGIDATVLPAGALAEGDMVELIGPSQPIATVAADAGTIPYEILTRLGARHLRRYVDGDRAGIVVPGGNR